MEQRQDDAAKAGDGPIQVLLVEDNAGDAFLLRDTLRRVAPGQFQITTAARLDDGLRRIGAGRFDVVLLDLSLPDSHGIDTSRRLRARAPELPVVVLSGLDDRTLAVRAVQEGAQDYLVKGRVSGELLVRSLRYAIERQRTTRYHDLLIERQRFDAAVSQMSDGIVVTDAAGRITTANHAAALLLGIADDAAGRVALDDALGPFELSVPLDELRASPQRVRPFVIHRRRPEPALVIDARLTRVLDPAGRLSSLVLTLRDVTAERHHDRMRASFLTLVPHKLRTPLTVLTSCFYLWKRLSPERAAQKRATMLRMCDENLQRLTETVNTMLDFGALDSVAADAAARPADVPRAIADVCDAIRRRYPAKPTAFHVHVAPDATHTRICAEHLAFVLEKTVDNAVKFGDKDPVRVDVRVAREGQAWLRVSVTDNGPGVPHEYQDRVFEGFVQVEPTMTGQVPGLGVGLFLARQTIEANGGTITLRSRRGESCTVAFTLPAAQPRGPDPHD